MVVRTCRNVIFICIFFFLNVFSSGEIHCILKRRKECLVSADMKWCDIKPALVSMEFKHLSLNKQYYCASDSAERMWQTQLGTEREAIRERKTVTQQGALQYSRGPATPSVVCKGFRLHRARISAGNHVGYNEWLNSSSLLPVWNK